MYRNVIKTFDDNTTLRMLRCFRRLIPCYAVKDILIRDKNRMILLILVIHTVDNLAFLKTTVSDRSKTRIPVMEAVLADDLLLIFRLVNLSEVNALGLRISCDHIFAMQDILFF